MRIDAMGRLRLAEGEQLLQQQSLALLCYLAIDGRKSRDHLAQVFWPEAKRPLNNLSSALTRIRQIFPEAVVIDDTTVGTTLSTDVGLLRDAVEKQDATAILELYTGQFFEGTGVRSMGLELEEWVFTTREMIAASASLALLDTAAASTNREQAADLAESAFRIGRTVWESPDQWLIAFQLLSADSRVLAQRVRIEAAERGIKLDATAPATGAVHAAPQPPAPSIGPAFFGRSSELERLTAFASGPPGRWLTVVGMGGVGKTALVRHFLRELRAQRPEVPQYFVSFREADNIDEVAELAASALGITYTDLPDLIRALSHRLDASNPAVLVLDNLEHITDSHPVVAGLTALAELRVIVTTRIVLHDDAEALLTLRGFLDAPDGVEAAVDLFVSRAPHDAVAEADRSEIAAICELVAGHPLAIELCAGWLRSVPLPALISSLRHSTEMVNVAPTSALETIDALLQRSWDLLTDDDAELMRRLSMFDGPFSFEDVSAVSDCSLPLITRLVDRSLVSLEQDRFALHPLVRDDATDRRRIAGTVNEQKLTARYVDYYRQRMLLAARDLRGPTARDTAQQLSAEFANVHVAWNRARYNAQWFALSDLVDGVDQYLKASSRQTMAIQMFDSALDDLAKHKDLANGESTARRAYVAIAWRHALQLAVQGDRDRAAEVIGDGWVHCDSSDTGGRVGLHYVEGHSDIFAGRYEDAAQRFEKAEALIDDTIDEFRAAEVLDGIGLCATALGDIERARTALRAVLDVGRRTENPSTMCAAYYSLGAAEMPNDPQLALVLFEEGRAVAEAASLTHMVRKLATLAGHAYIEIGETEKAIETFSRAVANPDGNAPDAREPWVLAANQGGLGTAYGHIGDWPQAAEWFARALRTEVQINDWPLMLETILDICRCRVDPISDPQHALHEVWVDLLRLVAHDPTTVWDIKDEAVRMLADAGAQGSPNPTLGSTPRLDVTAETAMRLLPLT